MTAVDTVDEMAKIPDMPPTISVREAAKRWGVTRQTIINWIRSGHLIGHRTPGGKLWRVEVPAVAPQSDPAGDAR